MSGPRVSDGFCFFPTAGGVSAIAWEGAAIKAVLLPSSTVAETRRRTTACCPELRETPPPAFVRRWIKRLGRHLDGDPQDFAEAPLATAALSAFARNVYVATRAIPSGETRSYGEIASLIGAPGAARAVGTALGRNPFPILIPCHRVLGQKKRIGGFSAPGGVTAKRAMLLSEGASLTPSGRIVLANARTLDAAVRHLASSSPVMAEWVARVGPPALPFTKPVETFAALGRSIVFQQLNGKAAATIYARVEALFPNGSVTASAMERVTDDGLRGAGLSANKVLALRDLARRSLDGTVPPLALLRRMTDDEVVERVVLVRGIGRWTVEMFLLFRLRRLDVWPVDDFGVQTGYARLFGVSKPSAKAMTSLGNAFRPYRSVASWYLWRAADEAKTLKR